jgi:hypothetical protein
MILMSAFARGDDAESLLGISGLGFACFLIGIGLIINALFFTRTRQKLGDSSPEARSQNLADAGYAPPELRAQTTSNLGPPTSVTEHTTLHLKQDR